MEQISDLTLLVFRTSFGRTHMWCLSGAAAASQFNLATCTMWWWWWSGAGGEEEVWDFGSQQGNLLQEDSFLFRRRRVGATFYNRQGTNN